MPIVLGPFMETRGLPDKSQGGHALRPERYRILQMPINEDPTMVVGVPQRGDTRTLGDQTYRVDRAVAQERKNETTVDVDIFWSSDGRWSAPTPKQKPSPTFKPYTITHERQRIMAPYFRKAEEDYADASGTTRFREVWDYKPEPRDFELTILAQTVVLLELSDAQLADAIVKARAARGKFHQIPLFGTDIFQYASPSIRQSAPGRLEIAYVWKSDPGSCGRGYVPDVENAQNTIIAKPRPPWGSYSYLEATYNQGTLTAKPVVYCPTIATPTIVDGGLEVQNPLWDPDGWRTLPGAPLQ